MNELIYCPWEPATFLFISSNVPLLINYSHYVAIFSAVAVALFIFLNDPKRLLSRFFLFFATLFTLWALLDVLLWATNDPAAVMFSWSLQVLLEPTMYATAFVLFYLYIHNKVPPLRYNLLISLLLLPLIVLLPTTLNLEALQLSTCESIEGPLAKYYTYIINITFTLLIVAVAIRNFGSLGANKRRSVLLFATGLVTFLLSFTSGNIVSSFTDDWTISQYGLFGMPFFAALIAYSIVHFNTFRIQVAGAQILVVTLWAIVGSLLFVDEELIDLIAIVTLGFTTILGFMLLRGIKQEFAHRAELEQLTKKLASANKRLRKIDQMKSEFVSIASHQLRSPLTAIRGYASLLADGSFGKLPKKATEAAERIHESSATMASSIEDFLNVSRIESGNMKYNNVDFNLNTETEHIVDDKRREAVQHGLLLTFSSKLKQKQGIVNADLGKTRQILHNLINNAIKYTESGSIEVTVQESNNNNVIEVVISDTGIGMSTDDMESLFEKFQRADNAHAVNTTGTGLGLFIAQQMAKEMGGEISAQSEGRGRGSMFTLTLPLQM